MDSAARTSSKPRLTPVAPWPTAGTVEEHVRAETVRAVYEQAIAAPLLTLLVTGLVAVALWRVAPHARLLMWLGLIALLSLVRMGLVIAYRRSRPTPIHMIAWERAFVYTLVGICLVWGVGSLIVMPASLAHRALIYFFLIGIAGGAVASYSAHPTACLLSVLSLMVPVTIWFAFQNVIELRVMAAAGAMYLVASARATRNYGVFWRETFRLSWELQRAHALAQKLSRTDDLTGLNNRRAFTSLGNRALEQARRYNRPLALIMFDIDRFKVINDTHGHAAGDRVLQEVAVVVLRNARSADVSSRIGGEEFAVLLPETEKSQAVTFAERLRVDLEQLELVHDGATLQFTCSFGVAARGEDVAVLDTLLKLADEALYRAKSAGRNRVSE